MALSTRARTRAKGRQTTTRSRAMVCEGMDVLGTASDNTAAGPDIWGHSHTEYGDLNSAGGNGMQVADGYALGARGAADIDSGLRQMTDGEGGRTMAEGGVRAAGTAVQSGAGLVVALSKSGSKTNGTAGQAYGGGGMSGSAASGLLGLNDRAKSRTKGAQDPKSMSRDAVVNEAEGMTKSAVDV
jgi:hypothetical protein